MTRQSTTKAPVLPPTKTVEVLWGTVLTIPAGPGPGDDFEARVRRAWEQMKAGYFAAAEHGRLREVLAGVIAAERPARAIGLTRSSRVQG